VAFKLEVGRAEFLFVCFVGTEVLEGLLDWLNLLQLPSDIEQSFVLKSVHFLKLAI
jgi:hypothetical protein